MVVGEVMDTSHIVIALLKVEFADGTVHFFSTGDTGWLSSKSYVTAGTAWATTIDWTKHEPGWSTIGFQPGADWSAAVPDHSGGTKNGEMPARALQMPLSAVLDEVKPVMVEPVGTTAWSVCTTPCHTGVTVTLVDPTPAPLAGDLSRPLEPIASSSNLVMLTAAIHDVMRWQALHVP